MRYVIALIMVGMLSGCALLGGSGTSVCDAVNEGESLICDRIGNPESLDKGLLLANYAAIREGAYSTDEAMGVLNSIEEIVVAGGITYAYLLKQITALLDSNDAAAIILILSPESSKLDVALEINEFDQKLLLAHIANQKELLSVLQ